MRKFALLLTIIGAVVWGIFGIFDLNIIGYIFGGTFSVVSKVIYIVVGLAGLYLIPELFSQGKNRKIND